ncbi:MAG: PAS domain S-box protein, partial [Chloroflexota bacterium]
SLESHAYAGRYIGDVLPPEQVQVIQDTIDTCITTNEKQVIEYELQFPSGSRWLESRIAPTDLTVKGYRTVVLIARDITHHKNLQHELRSLINATSYLFTGHDLQEVGEQIVKAVVNELGQADCGLLLVDDEQETMIRVARAGEYEVKADQPLYVDGGGVVTHAIREEKSIYISNTSTDERYVANQAKTRSELVVPLWSEGAVIGALDLQSPELHAFSSQQRRLVEIFATRASSAINIRQLINEINQNNAELELRVAQRTTLLQRTTEQIQGILNSSKDVIILSNAEGLIEQVNPAFEEQFAYRATSIFNEALDILIVEDDRDDFRQCREQVVTDKQMQRLDVQARTLNETAFFADIVLSPIMNDEEQVDGIICSIRDISQRKQLETDLRQALKKEKELNDLKSRFVSMVSHEYRTPLATIQLAAEGLQRYRNRMSEADMDKRLRRISEQTQYMTQLMEDMLSISKTQAKGLAY